MEKPIIMLADHSRFFLQIEKGFLRGTDAEVVTAEIGTRAWEMACKHKPDLIYLADDLPGLPARDFCLKRQACGHFPDSRIVLVCSHPQQVEEVKGVRDLCDAVLSKPLDRNAFLECGKAFLCHIERRLKRVPCTQLIVYRCGHESYYGTSVDISEGGMYLSCSRTFRSGDRLALNFVLPCMPSEVIEMHGAVVWVNQGRGRLKKELPSGVGLLFEKLPAGFAKAIKACAHGAGPCMCAR